jgi:hypothetical protein
VKFRRFYRPRTGDSRFEFTRHLVQVAGVSAFIDSCEVQLWVYPELDQEGAGRVDRFPSPRLPDPTIVRLQLLDLM